MFYHIMIDVRLALRQVVELSARLNNIELDIHHKKQKIQSRDIKSSNTSPKTSSALSSPASRQTAAAQRTRRLGVSGARTDSLGLNPSELHVSTDNLSAQQRERIRAVSETTLRHSSNIKKSRSADCLTRTWNNNSIKSHTSDVIHEEAPCMTTQCAPSLERLFSRDVIQPKSADLLDNHSDAYIFDGPQIEFQMAGRSLDNLDTPMKDLVTRSVSSKSSGSASEASSSVPCGICLGRSFESDVTGSVTTLDDAMSSNDTSHDSIISQTALLHISVSTAQSCLFCESRTNHKSITQSVKSWLELI